MSRTRYQRLKLAHKGWGDRLEACRRKKEDRVSTLSYGALVEEYCYNRDMWRWIRGYAPKPAKRYEGDVLGYRPYL